jgi:hypothetical protein
VPSKIVMRSYQLSAISYQLLAKAPDVAEAFRQELFIPQP